MLEYAAQYSKSLYPILDQNMQFSTPVTKIRTSFQTWLLGLRINEHVQMKST